MPTLCLADELVSTTRFPAPPTRPIALVSSVASDSHTWNLVYLQAVVEELGYDVVNLGACVPDHVLAGRCAEIGPDLVALSSINGHGYRDALRVAPHLRATLRPATPMVIGGKLGIHAGIDDAQVTRLHWAGFDAVFQDGPACVAEFRRFVLTRSRAATSGFDARTGEPAANVA